MEKISQEEKELRKQVDKIYTPLSVAKEEIWRRWNDKKLRKKVEEFLNGDVPDFLKDEPKAVLVRYVNSPNIELQYFLDFAKMAGMDFSLVEYPDDKLVAQNTCKYHLGYVIVHKGRGKKLGDKLDHYRIIDFNKYEGKKIDEIRTLWNNSIVDFHHSILEKCYPEVKNKSFNFSKWFNKNKLPGRNYYVRYLSLFICHGILFENYLLNNEEKTFTLKKVLPALEKIKKIFGISPLIVPLQPFSSENDPYWYYYNGKISTILENYLSEKHAIK